MTDSPFSLAGRTALITGSGRGLGFAMAAAMAEAGARVILNGRDPATLRAAAAKIAAPAVEWAAFDIADHSSAKAAIADITARHCGIDILVNNVGVRNRKVAYLIEPSDMRDLLDVDLVATAWLAREVAIGMASRRRGSIINITSVAYHGASQDYAYTAAKAGLMAVTVSLAAEFGPSGVRVNAIAPGLFATEFNAEMIKSAGDKIAGRTVLGRIGDPREIAAPAVFLASDAASFITGQEITIDGGLTLFRP